ncbi:MAG TPA: TIM barrel protein [Abditibacteriaceae bacterium]|jgi:sugar phosphate isomerase/epimerase
MIQPGLVSISFRTLSARDVCELAARCKLRGIEWGGDIHVPHGDAQAAREAAQISRDFGLDVAAYGSYYRAGTKQDFAPVLASALELGAPSIRVWAGNEGSAQTDAQKQETITEDLIRIAETASAQGVVVATEYHGGTLTDTPQSCAQLLCETQGSGLQTLWQPLAFTSPQSEEENLAALREASPRLLNVHVYQWLRRADGVERRPLREGRDEWRTYFAALPEGNRWALLEFVVDDAPENLDEDARALREILSSL